MSEYKGYTIEVEQDVDAPDPRKEFDNLGVMVCWHRRYDLGDVKAESYQETPDEFIEWAEKNAKNVALILPLYLYDHSGLRIKVGGFAGLLPEGHAEFDTMQVGFIYVTKDALRKEYSKQRLSKKMLAHACKVLRGEIEEYDQYLSGDVWNYVIEELDDSVCGCFGYDYCLKEAQSAIDYHIEHSAK
jgi:hypothetical protein